MSPHSNQKHDVSSIMNCSSHDEKVGAQGFVDLFIEKRLLIADADPRGEVTVSVAHEALLREWQRVREWLTQNREFLRMRGRLESSLELWLSRGQQKDDLLGPGLPLAEGEKLAKDFGSSLNREQSDYIRASTAERNRRKHAQARIRFGMMAAISALAIVAGFQWLQAEHHRQRAENNAAMAQAEAARTKGALASEAEAAAKLQEQLRQASWASSTRPSVSSNWESGRRVSLFLHARSSSTRKTRSLQSDSSKSLLFTVIRHWHR